MSDFPKGLTACIIAIGASLIVLAPIAAYFAGRNTARKEFAAIPPIEKTDTLWKTDTLFFPLPVPVPQIIEMPPVEIPIIDSGIILQEDSLSVPIIQKHYTDSTYEAWVSGYLPSLDSLKIFPRTAIVTMPSAVKEVKTRWGIGIQAGYGASKDGLTPYIGIGFSYNLLAF